MLDVSIFFTLASFNEYSLPNTQPVEAQRGSDDEVLSYEPGGLELDPECLRAVGASIVGVVEVVAGGAHGELYNAQYGTLCGGLTVDGEHGGDVRLKPPTGDTLEGVAGLNAQAQPLVGSPFRSNEYFVCAGSALIAVVLGHHTQKTTMDEGMTHGYIPLLAGVLSLSDNGELVLNVGVLDP